MQGSGLKGQDKISFWKKSPIRLLKHACFFCLKWRTRQRQNWLEGNCKIKTNFNLVKIFIAGLNSEGLYRVSGFSDLIEDVKMAFDRGTVFCCMLCVFNVRDFSAQPLSVSCSAASVGWRSPAAALAEGESPHQKSVISFTLAFYYQNLLFSFHQYLCFSNDVYRKGRSSLNYCPSLQVKLRSGGWGRDRGQVVKCLKRAVRLKSIFLDESPEIIRWIQ